MHLGNNVSLVFLMDQELVLSGLVFSQPRVFDMEKNGQDIFDDLKESVQKAL